jgi:hypothetical protein
MLVDLIIGERRVGDRRQQQAIRPELPRIFCERLRLVCSKRSDADDDRDLAADGRHRRFNRPAPLIARQEGVTAGAAEQADGIGARGLDAGKQGGERVGIDNAGSI